MKLKCKQLVMLPSRVQGGPPKTIWTDVVIECSKLENVRRPIEEERLDVKRNSLITMSGVTSVINASFEDVCAAWCDPEEKIMTPIEEEKPGYKLTLGKGGEA